MLLNLTKRLCPWMSLAALALSCGKKINDAETTTGGGTTEPQRPSSILVLEVNSDEETKTTYDISLTGWFYMPEKLTVKKGDGRGQRVYLFQNIDSIGDHEFVCSYYGFQETELSFERCENFDGQTLVSSAKELAIIPFIHEAGKHIRMELDTPISTGLTIYSVYTVDWVIPE
jgi:hypothetical protein